MKAYKIASSIKLSYQATKMNVALKEVELSVTN